MKRLLPGAPALGLCSLNQAGRMRALIVGALIIVSGVAVLEAQRFFGQPSYPDNLAYDGRFTFVRLRWESGRGFGRRGGNSDAWNHDYPRAEQNLALLLKDITFVDARTDGSMILTLDDPLLFKYPIAYMWEPGFWVLSDEEALRFREYLQKGGFAIFDDFEQDQWIHYEEQKRRELPDGRFVKLDASHEVFDTFFRMKTIDFPHPIYGILPTYYGIFEDNDPSKRLMVIANHNHDVAEYWEFSGQGLFPVDTSNEAYKLGINYMLYGLMH
jgi:hypothetical protein